jgi:hypothetical protein
MRLSRNDIILLLFLLFDVVSGVIAFFIASGDVAVTHDCSTGIIFKSHKMYKFVNDSFIEINNIKIKNNSLYEEPNNYIVWPARTFSDVPKIIINHQTHTCSNFSCSYSQASEETPTIIIGTLEFTPTKSYITDFYAFLTATVDLIFMGAIIFALFYFIFLRI